MDKEKENASPKPGEPCPVAVVGNTATSARGRLSKVLISLLAITSIAVLVWALLQSNNGDGRLVGRWRLESASGGRSGQATERLTALVDAGVYMYFEFRSDGTFTTDFGAERAEDLEWFKTQLVQDGIGVPKTSGSYTLGSGDTVWMGNFKSPTGSDANGKTRVKSSLVVKGDTLTMNDADGTTMKMSRIVSPSAPTVKVK